jgi:hypothetical protein
MLPSASIMARELKYALFARSKKLNGRTTPSSRASAWNRSRTGLAATERANAKWLARWSLQK